MEETNPLESLAAMGAIGGMIAGPYLMHKYVHSEMADFLSCYVGVPLGAICGGLATIVAVGSIGLTVCASIKGGSMIKNAFNSYKNNRSNA